MVLDWDEPIPEQAKEEPHDLIMSVKLMPGYLTRSAADVTYNTAAFPALLSTLVALLAPDESGNGPLLILAYKERDPAERDLWSMLSGKGIWMVKIGDVFGADTGTGETEIWVGGKIPPPVAIDE